MQLAARERGLRAGLVLREQADDKGDGVPCDRLSFLVEPFPRTGVSIIRCDKKHLTLLLPKEPPPGSDRGRKGLAQPLRPHFFFFRQAPQPGCFLTIPISSQYKENCRRSPPIHAIPPFFPPARDNAIRMAKRKSPIYKARWYRESGGV